MEWYMAHVWTHVPHLDLVDFGQNVFTTPRDEAHMWYPSKKFESLDATSQ